MIFGRMNDGAVDGCPDRQRCGPEGKRLLGFVWLGLFFVYYFSREGQDERGRKVIAIAALCAFIMLFIVMNVLGYVFGSGWGGQNVTRTMNCLQAAYSAVLLTADVVILIARRLPVR